MFSGREVSIADLWMDLSDPESTLFGHFGTCEGVVIRVFRFCWLGETWVSLLASGALTRQPLAKTHYHTVSTTKAATRSCHHASSPACLPACLELPQTLSAVCRPAALLSVVLLPCCPVDLSPCLAGALLPCCT